MRFVTLSGLGTSLAIISLAILLGCQTPTPTVATDSFCDIARPISYSSRDTDQTRAEVLSHNAAGCAVCPEHQSWKPKCVGQYRAMEPVP